jgi:hypothetical protein
METATATYLAWRLDDDRIERRTRNGAKDRGDIGGVRTIAGARMVLEVKDSGGQVQVGPWLNEAETERGNDDALLGVVVFKRRGIPYSAAGAQGVLMTLETFAALVDGGIDDRVTVEPDPHTQVVGN